MKNHGYSGVAGDMQWVVERGTFWVFETDNGLPPVCPARIEVVFQEVGVDDYDDLAVAMNLPSPQLIQQRLKGRRRCFILKREGQITTYGWVTYGPEAVGELERTFNLRDDEAYVWDCGTVPAWRGQRCYSALLSQIVHQLHCEDTPRIWIGASRQNAPSVQGIANAGFELVLDLIYRRFYPVKMLWFQPAPSAPPHLVTAAYRILLNKHEYRLGQLAIGFR
jgi:hypothetical protein